MSQHIDGEQEQIESVEPLHRAALTEIARWSGRPPTEAVIELLRWLAREAFRAGYRHAHEKKTVVTELWPEDED